MAARSKTWVYDRSLAGMTGSKPASSTYLSVVSVVCCQVEVSVMGLSLVQRSPTEGRFVYVCVTDLITGHYSFYSPTVIRKKERKKERIIFCMQLINSKESGL